MNLVIVESPTKARKLKSYLGSGFAIEASVGHIRDLPRKEVGVDVADNFKPSYEVSDDKKKVISVLKKLASGADIVYLATDPDREGEAIAWHLAEILTSVSPEKFKRATFHEITKQAVTEAISHPSTLNMDLVNAQQARRIVDRLVGYEVSPVLWKKIRRGLSAGRVQSVAVRLIVEREREIAAFKPEEYWEVDVALNCSAGAVSQAVFVDNKVSDELPDGVIVARVSEVNGKKYEPTAESDVTLVIEELPAGTYTVRHVEKKERQRNSFPPFTTSTLQQAAANSMGMSSKQTMRIAQELYEEGLITYHRTDAVNLSQQSLEMAREYIQTELGAAYVLDKPRHFANKSKNAQEAHEAIRVTDVKISGHSVAAMGGKMTERHGRLYDLIWRRFLASQLPAAVYDQTVVTVHGDLASLNVTLRASGSVLKFDGWLRLFPDREDVILPAVEVEQELSYVQHAAAQKFTQPPARFNDASLVKELERLGIGRPSTYASIISVIEDRGYVARDAKRFVATAIGMTVTDFLMQHFPMFMEYQFTAEMEENLDSISRGEKEWVKVVRQFYTPFHAKIEESQTADRAQVPVEKTGVPCPLCGDSADAKGEVVIRDGRFGKFKSCSRYPECKYTENIVETVEGVLCPLCHTGAVIARKSRWGKDFFGCKRYPECDWASWKKPEPGLIVTPEEWAEQKAAREERKKLRAAKYPVKEEKAKKPAKKTAKKTVKKAPKKAASKKK